MNANGHKMKLNQEIQLNRVQEEVQEEQGVGEGGCNNALEMKCKHKAASLRPDESSQVNKNIFDSPTQKLQ